MSSSLSGATPALAGARGRVLIVEDDEDSLEIMGAFLTTLGFAVRGAHDGPTAIEIARVFRPSAGLVDLGLPEMDGYEVARRLQASSGSEIKLIAISGFGDVEARQRSKQAGFHAHLVKPVDFRSLTSLLSS